MAHSGHPVRAYGIEQVTNMVLLGYAPNGNVYHWSRLWVVSSFPIG